MHQFCRIGAHAIIGGCAKIVQDVPPFLIADGNPAHLRGVNHVGLERRGFAEADIKALRRAYRILADKTLNFSQAVEKIEASEDAANAARQDAHRLPQDHPARRHPPRAAGGELKFRTEDCRGD